MRAPLRRLIQSAIGAPLARLLIAGDVTTAARVTVDVGEDGLVLTVDRMPGVGL